MPILVRLITSIASSWAVLFSANIFAGIDAEHDSIMMQRPTCVRETEILAFGQADNMGKDCVANAYYCSLRNPKSRISADVFECCSSLDADPTYCAYRAMISLTGPARPATVPNTNDLAIVGTGTTAPTEATPPEDARAEVTSAINSCRQTLSRATTCCNDPYACGSVDASVSSSSSGMSACMKQRKLAEATSKVNNQLSAICSSNQSSCPESCAAPLAKYKELQRTCAGTCPNAAAYDNAVSSLSGLSNQCSALREKANLLAEQASSSARTLGAAERCEKETDEGGKEEDGSVAPSSLADMLKEDKGDDKDEVDELVDCMANPNSPNCQKAQAQEQLAKSSEAGFTDQRSAKALDDFNVDDVPMPADGYISSAASGTTEAPTVNTVPNNSGGGIPGGAAAAGGAAAPRKAGMAPASYSTEVFTGGFQAGGYSAPAGQNAAEARDDVNRGRRPANAGKMAGGANGFQVGMDLKSFLPGAKNDPNRMRLGAHAVGGGASKEITNKFTDNWNKMSVKFKERCILELKDCDLQP